MKERISEEHFWDRVDTSAGSKGCWPWLGAKDVYGYGVVKVRRPRAMVKAHRVAFALFRGDMGAYCVCHRCDNRHCCNPDHLFLGTQEDNMADRHAKGRSRGGSHTPRGKVLTDMEVSAIRFLRKNTSFTRKEIGNEFGVSAGYVGDICAGRDRVGSRARMG